MTEKIRVLIQMKHTAELGMAATRGAAAGETAMTGIEGFHLDPAYAPGVSHHEPGGLTTREGLNLLQGIQAPIVGADIVEFNPSRDTTGITAALAAKLVKEMAGQMMATTPDTVDQWEKLQC